MKRAVILITLVTAIAATAAAQPGPPPPPRGDELANYLQLTDAQKSAWQAAHAEFEAAVKAAHDTLQAKITATLTPEQKTKFEAFEAARKFLGPKGSMGPMGHPGPPR
jgi:Spy/CpxP family protein refolding chaperone